MIFIIARLIFDILAIISAYLISYSIKFDQISLMNPYSDYLFFIVFIYLVCFYFVGMYKTRKGFLVEIDELVADFASVSFSWLIIIAFTFIRREYIFSRPIILLSLPISFGIILIERYVILKIEMFARARGYGSKRAVIIGSGELADSVANKIREHPSYGINFIGFINSDSKRSLGDIEKLEEIIDQNNITAVYAADASLNRQVLTEIAKLCSQKGISLGTLPDVFNILTTSPSVEDIEGFPIVNLRSVQFSLANRFIKRAADIILSMIAIILSAIPIAVISILIKITSPGPVIFVQKRVGTKGKIFRLYKFRTMIHKAERLTGPVLATENDPRKTAFGRILRSSKLDELPQLFNILKGDMSFVGPRPERPVFVRKFKELIPKYMERHNFKVGLAGWAQMHGGYDMPADEKIKYDLYYIENWSFLLDLKILIKCLEIAFFQRRPH